MVMEQLDSIKHEKEHKITIFSASNFADKAREISANSSFIIVTVFVISSRQN